MRVGIEIGGTFTDLICVDGERVFVAKVPSTPKAPERGFADALAAAGIEPSQVTELVHGSTIATNAVLERKGVRVALVTTEGFRDVLWIQRQDKTNSYDLCYRKPSPVVARRDVIEIRERISADGSIIVPIDELSAAETLRAALDRINPDVVALSFLNAYVNPAHELAIQAIIGEFAPHLEVVPSHVASSEFREYERTSTTTLSAYVKPVIARYLRKIGDDLEYRGFKGRLSVMQSNGGRLPASVMQEQPITALLSGPAAGVTGAVRLAESVGHRNIITFDLGGTSADVSLVTNAKTMLKPMTRVDDLPVRTPVLDISTIGAGGGSIIWRDPGGMLRVGPQSSGADPGPACYGRGGNSPTLTDAHVVRGTLQADRFLGGKAKLDREAAEQAFAGIAAEFSFSIEEAADSAIRVANAQVVRAIQGMSTTVGKDPRGYALMAFGGAGPLHAARIAEELAITEVIIPANAGVLSAVGLLSSDYMVYETATKKILVDEEAPNIVRSTFERIRQTAEARLASADVSGPFACDLSLLMRYVGQAFEIEVQFELDDLEAITEEILAQSFDHAMTRQFQHRPASRRPFEIVGFRCGVLAARPDIAMARQAELGQPADAMQVEIYEHRSRQACSVVGWPLPGREIAGPAIIDATTSTVFVPSGWRASIEEQAGCLMLRGGAPS